MISHHMHEPEIDALAPNHFDSRETDIDVDGDGVGFAPSGMDVEATLDGLNLMTQNSERQLFALLGMQDEVALI
jgi:hypothetical protein